MRLTKRNRTREIFQILRELNPHPTTELKYSSGFELLVAVVLSAQSTDKGVNIATEKLFAVANTPQKIAELSISKLEDYIKTIGLYKTKAINIHGLSNILLEKYNGEVPNTREELESLPGVGRKTANVILNTLYHQPVMAVDTHIFRVANRLGIALGANVTEVEAGLMKVIPKEFMLNAHHWLILQGRYICIARKPKCEICPISQYCDYFTKLIG